MSEKPNGEFTRRDFARMAVTAAAAAAISTTAPGQAEKTTPAPQKPPETPIPLSPSSQSEAARAFDSVIAKFGDRFNEEQKKDLRRLINQQQKSLDTLRAFTLNNSDEPATVLRLDGTRG